MRCDQLGDVQYCLTVFIIIVLFKSHKATDCVVTDELNIGRAGIVLADGPRRKCDGGVLLVGSSRPWHRYAPFGPPYDLSQFCRLQFLYSCSILSFNSCSIAFRTIFIALSVRTSFRFWFYFSYTSSYNFLKLKAESAIPLQQRLAVNDN